MSFNIVIRYYIGDWISSCERFENKNSQGLAEAKQPMKFLHFFMIEVHTYFALNW